MIDEYSNTRDTNLGELLKSIHMPVMILKGECDYCLWGVTHQYETLFPNSTLLYVKNVGHILYLDEPGLVIDAMQSFLLDEPLPAYIDSLHPKISLTNLSDY